jgi:hypothetical protein
MNAPIVKSLEEVLGVCPLESSPNDFKDVSISGFVLRGVIGGSVGLHIFCSLRCRWRCGIVFIVCERWRRQMYQLVQSNE